MRALGIAEGERCASQLEQMPWRRRAAYLAQLFQTYRRRGFSADELLLWQRSIERITSSHGRTDLKNSTVVEIGVGQRPHRLIWMSGLAARVVGIDLDRPLFTANIGDVMRIVRKNGALRAAKTLFRSLCFDRKFYAGLAKLYSQSFDAKMPIPEDRIRIGDASSSSAWEGLSNVDLVYSEDVFEHIPREKLEKLCARVHDHLAADGLFVVRVNVFTGITGGHVPEWYREALDDPKPRRSEPWGHLRPGWPATDTYLNRLRPSDYEDLFSQNFEILEKEELYPNLGREWLSERTLREAPGFGREELLANFLRFVLRPKRNRLAG